MESILYKFELFDAMGTTGIGCTFVSSGIFFRLEFSSGSVESRRCTRRYELMKSESITSLHLAVDERSFPEST
ncbi:hypothetical protein AB3S75_025883 [Citrus x aurantiifolia]